ncbi:MAG: type IV toxin-antitoxin system AbiEi family antitoxin domain-containing protein [bacterium]|nr:type IV toxin-antitoxin system AbiEi family antitoxin domain-containing protein [bacterium]
MNPSPSKAPDHDALYEIASSQGGYFTLDQARDCGFDRYLVRHHAQTGKFRRVWRGVYRIAQFPPSPHDEIIAARMAVGPEKATVSHETALQIYDLSDVVPRKIHLTVPRGSRAGSARTLSSIQIHTTSAPFLPGEVVVREGMRVTSPARTIVDAAVQGTMADQVIQAVREAFKRGLTTKRELVAAASGRGARIARLIVQAIHEAESR